MSTNPHKIGDKVHHDGVAGMVVRIEGDDVLVQRHFNCSRYWDNQTYWEPLTDDVEQIGGIPAIMADQGKPTR